MSLYSVWISATLNNEGIEKHFVNKQLKSITNRFPTMLTSPILTAPWRGWWRSLIRIITEIITWHNSFGPIVIGKGECLCKFIQSWIFMGLGRKNMKIQDFRINFQVFCLWDEHFFMFCCLLKYNTSWWCWALKLIYVLWGYYNFKC